MTIRSTTQKAPLDSTNVVSIVADIMVKQTHLNISLHTSNLYQGNLHLRSTANMYNFYVKNDIFIHRATHRITRAKVKINLTLFSFI